MGNDQYAPTGALHKAEIMLFTHFHAQYPLKEKEGIIDGLLMAHQSGDSYLLLWPLVLD